MKFKQLTAPNTTRAPIEHTTRSVLEYKVIHQFAATLITFTALILSACSNRSYSTATPVNVNIVSPLIPKLEDVALLQESRMSGYIPADSRLAIINTTTGEEIWWKNNVSSSSGYIPYSVRDGTVLRSESELSLFLLNGGSSSFPIAGSYFTHRGSNETQFAVTYQDYAEVIHLFESAKTRLPHDKRLQLNSVINLKDVLLRSVFTFFSSPTNDQIISIDLLSLKFTWYNSTGVSALGASQFSPEAAVLCEASDLNKVTDLLLVKGESDESEFKIDYSRIPVAMALDSNHSGVLIKTRDERLIHLNFKKACAGKNAIDVLQLDLQETAGSRNRIVSLGDSQYAIQHKGKILEFVGLNESSFSVAGKIVNFCEEDIVTFRRYDDQALFACGKISTDGLKIVSLDRIQLLSLKSFEVLAETTALESLGVSGLAFDNSNPALFQLSSQSKGQLTRYDFSSGVAQKETKDNIILKNIIDKL